MATVLMMLSDEARRHEMTTSGINASLDQQGFLAVALWNETLEMHTFLVRVVHAHLGTIISMQELLHFAGTICEGEHGQVPITFDELIRIMQDLWFVEIPHDGLLKKGSLVRVNSRRRGTVRELKGSGVSQTVIVAFDEASLNDPGMQGEYPIQLVKPRMTVPTIPRVLVPKNIQTLVEMAMYQVNDFKEHVVPIASAARSFFRWQMPQYMVPLVIYLVCQASLAFHGFYDKQSLSFSIMLALVYIRNCIFGILFIAILFSRSKVVRRVRSIFRIIMSRWASRNAPDCWKFYKAADQPYSLDPPV
eukprot:TRINITY_DN52507_c0_g1_i1.p1 TRINITY_DN52507_c0_g1~~TRINITY_DN52507_c0_g1_i1.p1  ORF type:complete len:305 (-),score=31.92 TRINITY_DN52507_c0_g1_i1:53-967(-)